MFDNNQQNKKKEKKRKTHNIIHDNISCFCHRHVS